MVRRSREPVLWAMFSGGGMIAALLLPAVVAVLWIAAPLGWVEAPSYEGMRSLFLHPIGRLALFAVATLSFFHWAHRFRYTMYDGLQLYHLNTLIAILTYSIAIALTVIAGFVLVTTG